ncbi:auxin-responsive protein SAUR32-like [Lycium barbarum]|uniref:auxin-responsive protein SAUR32-like n=1 Tax=Lycium barbarum TaxID=112863 RepID=UPI00293ED9FC|nr:auxin-responsive protein SAUR32-like [Lycium barbarum]XP_060218339.1 auxin-responsive protein SAUR32-like [Lycium barbarum]XP_060218340.1 auxin-responsive protein SAUR32-like [Lycium barbarum]
MGGGERSLLHLPHLHIHQGKKKTSDVPKGYLAIKVGQEEEEQQRFVVPVSYFNHPLFIQLLKEAEEVYGFHHKGTITIPCHVEQFRSIQGKIDKHHHNHHHHIHVPCFRA